MYLEPLAKPVLPAADKDWPELVQELWAAWRKDPVTSQYTPADIAWITELAKRYFNLKPNEIRLRMDGLGLTPKGKRDLRWLMPAGQHVPAVVAPLAEVRRIRAIELRAGTGYRVP